MIDSTNTNFLFSIEKGFKCLLFTPAEAAHIITACKKRINRNFTMEDIWGGILKDLLIDEDYLTPFQVFLASHYRLLVHVEYKSLC